MMFPQVFEIKLGMRRLYMHFDVKLRNEYTPFLHLLLHYLTIFNGAANYAIGKNSLLQVAC